jgi:glutathione synthase/RimK-type ligase-like ATP-grasp enzyme
VLPARTNPASIALKAPSLDTAAKALAQLGGDVWARPSIGFGGNDVFHITNDQQLAAAVAHYAAAGMDWLITRDAQNFNHQGRRHQFRVVVLGERALRLCEHVQEDPDAPCNEAQGAVSTLLPLDALPAEMLRLAVRATQSLALPFGGVDLAVENGGVVFEVNVHPVIDVTQGLETVTIPYVQAHLAAMSMNLTKDGDAASRIHPAPNFT